jgi:hypothetical protein
VKGLNLTAFSPKVPALCGIFGGTFGENAGSLSAFTRSSGFFHRQRSFLSPAGERFCNRSKAPITIASLHLHLRSSPKKRQPKPLTDRGTMHGGKKSFAHDNFKHEKVLRVIHVPPVLLFLLPARSTYLPTSRLPLMS